ncbi:unnamed protein product [Rotaria sordida]|uniref:Uncharacterized protein n=1 Tax=Rotaria sordida TaxID=392033 RepID=A0A815U9T1_9BILA|nr:unnamed protein product [Rotaria sordida]CAF1516593.1 unnamed protein product [Rotaria sordida]
MEVNMNEVIPFSWLYADEHIPDELYAFVRNNLVDQLDTCLHSLTNPIEYLTALSWHGEEKLSLLMVAALHGHDEIVQVLLAHCQPQYQMELEGKVAISEGNFIDNITALQCACYRAHFTVAKTLIDIGSADVNHDNDKWPYYPLLIQASAENRLDIVRFLIENGYSNVNETQSNDRDRCTALIWAAFKGHASIIEYLIEKGADVNYSCKSDWSLAPTPITCAVLLGNVNAVQLLCNAGANTSAKFTNGATLLMTALKHSHFDVIDFLIKRSIATIDDLELTVCLLVDTNPSMNQLRNASKFFVLAMKYRESNQTPKVRIKPTIAYEYHQECQTFEELDAIKNDHDRMWIEILLIQERIMLPRSDCSLMRSLLARGDVLVSKSS